MKNETGNLIIRIVTTIGIYLWHNASVFFFFFVLFVLVFECIGYTNGYVKS